MKPPKQHAIIVSGRKTSITLEDVFWNLLKKVAKEREISLSALVSAIDSELEGGGNNFSASIRIFLLHYYRDLAEEYRQEIVRYHTIEGKFNAVEASDLCTLGGSSHADEAAQGRDSIRVHESMCAGDDWHR
jgi:predicted DNA-binding ribbon-helix-helix protein